MREFRRIFSARWRVFALILIVLINVGLFLWQQQSGNLGFSDEGGTDPKAARAYYEELLAKYRGADFDEALAEVTAIANYPQLYADITQIVRNRALYYGLSYWIPNWEAEYQQYLAEYPDVVEAIETGIEPDREAMSMQAAGAGKLMGQLTHLAGYGRYVTGVMASSERLKGFSIFGKEGSFARNNIEKTAKDFAAVDGVRLTLGRDDAITAFFSYAIGDWLLILVLAMTVTAFLDERQRGLWHTVYAAPNGRLRLAVRRAGILAVTSVVSVAVLYGSVLGLGFALYGGADELGRTAQSVALFKTLPMAVSLEGVLIQYFLLRMLSAFVIGLLLWLLMSISGSGVRLIIVGLAAFLTVEYSFYTILPDQSTLQILKYFNIFSYIDLSALYTKYVNLDVFTMPVNIRILAAWSCVPLVLLFGGGCIAVQQRMRPKIVDDAIVKLNPLINRPLDLLRSKFRLTGFEAYKLLFTQGGVLILAVFICIMINADFSVPVAASEADNYALTLQGEISRDTLDQINAIQQELIDWFDHGLTDLDEEFHQGGYNNYFETIAAHANDTELLSAITEVSYKAELLVEKGEALGKPLWLLYEMPYKGIYGPEASNVRTVRNLLALFALALLLAGVMAMEQTSTGLRQLLHGASRGRGAVLFRKFILSGAGILLLWAVPTFLEVRTLLSDIDPATLAAPVQSLSFLSEFPFPVSICGFLIGLYLCRLLALLSLGCIALFLSTLFRRLETAYAVTSATLVLPTVLYSYLNLSPFKLLSAARVTDMMGIITERQGQIGGGLFGLIVLILVGTICTFQTLRRWNRV